MINTENSIVRSTADKRIMLEIVVTRRLNDALVILSGEMQKNFVCFVEFNTMISLLYQLRLPLIMNCPNPLA